MHNQLSWSKSNGRVSSPVVFKQEVSKLIIRQHGDKRGQSMVESGATSRNSAGWATPVDGRKQSILFWAETLHQGWERSIYTSLCLSKTASIIKDQSQPGHSLFSHQARHRSLIMHISRFSNSIFPAVIRQLNGPLISWSAVPTTHLPQCIPWRNL